MATGPASTRGPLQPMDTPAVTVGSPSTRGLRAASMDNPAVPTGSASTRGPCMDVQPASAWPASARGRHLRFGLTFFALLQYIQFACSLSCTHTAKAMSMRTVIRQDKHSRKMEFTADPCTKQMFLKFLPAKLRIAQCWPSSLFLKFDTSLNGVRIAAKTSHNMLS